ncbi:MAG: hypothetical protein PVG07_15180 [Acidobacteriota bacterium]|jgi:N-acetylmuramoyl-L-alanine amidase
MKSKTLVTILAIGLLAAIPARAEQPFGFFDGRVGGGNSGSGLVPLTGWALDDDGVRAVDVFVDGRIAGRATYGANRPGVTARHPGFPDSGAAGFRLQLDTTRYLNGLHTVEARVTSETGERRFLNPVQLQITNTTHLLAPFGEIEFPRPSADLYGTCDMAASPRRLTAVTGWTLDAGVETGDMGVGYVELLIDGAMFANSRIDCFFSDTVENQGLTNCYGLRRFDLERIYPSLRNAPQSGYRFVMDIGALIDFGFDEGHHVLTVRVGDIAGQVANVDEIPVTFLCDNRIGNEEGFGWISPPRPGNIGDGVLEVTGWALDWEGVDRVLIYVDGSQVGQATLGFGTPRVAERYPGYPDNAAAGWRLQFDSNEFSDGRHGIQAVAVDERGRSTLLGEREFVIDNVP